MEERREDDNTEYTGEYGNTIQGEYQEDTTYRYTYSGKDESIHSGDYYASTNTVEAGSDEIKKKETDAWKDVPEQGAPNGAQPDSSQTENAAFGGQQGAQAQQGGNSSYGGYYQMPQGGKQPFGNIPPKPPKKPVSFGMKLLASVVCAVVFGVVAGVVFNGYNYMAAKMGNILPGNGQVEKTTVTEGKEADKQEDKKQTDVSKQADKKDVAAITEQTMPAVVAITSTSQGADYYDLFGQYYQGREATSSGSGFIVGQNDKELLIATNNHVVDDAKTISVQFIDGEIYEAKEKGADSGNDLAVIAVTISSVKKSTMEKIKIADMGNSDNAKVGEMVIAIGNALGYGQSVTVGYISAKDREIAETDGNGRGTGKTIKALQTDAAINPGNSGGALINMQGQVIGINSAKIAASSVEGVGYAIPISLATPILDELKKKEILTDDEKGYLGISGTEVTEQVTAFNMPYGVYVKEVAKGGAAEKGGIQAGDVITAVNKAEVTTMESLQEKVNGYRKGTKVEITIQRSNNGEYQEKKVTVELQGKESLDNLSDGSTTGGNNRDNGAGNDDGTGGNNSPGNGDGGSGNNGFGDDDDGFGSFWDFFR